MNALIGYSGKIGTVLSRKMNFSVLINSRKHASMANQRFEHVVCAAPCGDRAWVEAHPQEAREQLDQLLSLLAGLKLTRFTLISCAGVFSQPGVYDENTQPQACEQDLYASLRIELEQAVRDMFGRVLIVRLPEIFGTNVTPDFLHHLLAGHDLDDNLQLQVYPLYRLASDIELAWQLGLSTMHLACEPVRVGELKTSLFSDISFDQKAQIPRGQFAARLISRNYRFWQQGEAGYTHPKSSLLDDLTACVARIC